jgi:hypothetical protein
MGVLVWLVIACGGSADETGSIHDGGTDVAQGGIGGSSGATWSGGTGGTMDGSAGGNAGGVNDAAAGETGADQDAAADSSATDPCVEACTMAVAANCPGGPNDVAECPSLCAALAAKGPACKAASDTAYECVLDAGPNAVGCGSNGAHVKCGYCDAAVVELENACGFTTGCVQ